MFGKKEHNPKYKLGSCNLKIICPGSLSLSIFTWMRGTLLTWCTFTYQKRALRQNHYTFGRLMLWWLTSTVLETSGINLLLCLLLTWTLISVILIIFNFSSTKCSLVMCQNEASLRLVHHGAYYINMQLIHARVLWKRSVVSLRLKDWVFLMVKVIPEFWSRITLYSIPSFITTQVWLHTMMVELVNKSTGYSSITEVAHSGG